MLMILLFAASLDRNGEESDLLNFLSENSGPFSPSVSGNQDLCLGDALIEAHKGQGDTHAVNFEWTETGNPSNVITGPILDWSSEASFELRALNEDGICRSEARKVVIGKFAKPKVIEQMSCPTALGDDAWGTIKASDGFESYIWYVDNIEQVGENNQSFNYSIKNNAAIGVKGKDTGCAMTTKNISISENTDPKTVQLISDPVQCTTERLRLVVKDEYQTYEWWVNGIRDPGAMNVLNVDLPTPKANMDIEVRGIPVSGCPSDILSFTGQGETDCNTALGTLSNENYVHETTVNVAMVYNETDIEALDIMAGEKAETWNYLDGFGRPMQVVQQQASPLGHDVVQAMRYDDFGRERIGFLPYVLDESDQNTQAKPGMYKPDAVHSGIKNPRDYRYSPQYKFYKDHFGAAADDPEYPYAEKRFEPSPLNRVLQEAAPGKSWHFGAVGKDKDGNDYLLNSQISYGYRSNGPDEVRLWTVDMSNTLHKSYHKLESTGWYGENELYLNVVTDENGSQIWEYKDKQGQVVLKKVQLADEADLGVHDGWACTYYVYDDFGNLRYVIPPQAVQDMVDDATDSWALVQKEDFIDNWLFYYSYDGRQRMATKKVPGADMVYMVYDKRDRLVLTQDGNQRSTEYGEDNTGKAWSFTKYDVLNRPVISGVYIHNVPDESQLAMQNHVIDRMGLSLNGEDFAWYESRNESDAMHGYNNASFPKANADGTALDVLTVSYYDDYSFLKPDDSAESYFDTDGNSFAYAPDFSTFQPDADEINRDVKGKVTGSKVKVLDPGVPEYLSTVSYYDDRYRPVQSMTENHLGELETMTSCYADKDLTANIAESYTSTTMKATPNVQRTFTYDHAKRLETVQHTLIPKDAGGLLLDPENTITLIKNTYNELGELESKKLHRESGEDAWQSVDYQYNIRGWLTHINDAVLSEGPDSEADDLFGMELYYTDGPDGFDVPTYNGNISGVKWKSAVDEDRMAYGYTYDKLNRIIGAHYAAGTKPPEGQPWKDERLYNMEIKGAPINEAEKIYESGYDLNGNIKFLMRDGFEASQDAPGHPSPIDRLEYDYVGSGNQLNKVSDAGTDGGFKDGDNTGNDYLYDDNGNMIVDENKGITNIKYNLLNLPREIQMTGSRKMEYIYDAAGIKLAQRVYEDDTQAPDNATKTTDYIGERIYESNATETQALQFIHHEEGRIVPGPDVNDINWTPNSKAWEYQYNIKDHLGNTRVTFADPLVDYLVTMEGGADRVEEQNLGFDNLDLTQHQDQNNVFLLDHTKHLTNANGENIYPNADMVCFLNGTGDRIFGPAKSLQVMPGDEIELSVYYKYKELLSGTDTKTLADLLLSAYNASFAKQLGELALASGSNLDASFLESAMEVIDGENGSSIPDAYLNIIIVDENFGNAVGYKKPIGSDGTVADMGKHGELMHSINIDKKGYAYIYLSNETPGSEVYFDDFLIEHKPNPIIQKDDYYPFGMSIAGLNFGREYALENKFLYNGKELQNELDLDWYDYGARMYDAAIGKFHVIDPNAENYLSWTPYNYVANNPLNLIDPDGMDWYDINGTIEWRDQEGDLTIDDQTYSSLGKNVLVGTHNRDKEGNEDPNTATFSLYLESNTKGATATLMGNTVPSDTKEFGTLAEGIYPAKFQARASKPGENALLINEGKELPTLNGNPNKKNSDMLTEVFFHRGNPYQESLRDRAGNPVWSHGCQTGGCGPGSLDKFNAFMENDKDFKGNYYLRAKPSGNSNGQKNLGSFSPYIVPSDATSRIKVNSPLIK